MTPSASPAVDARSAIRDHLRRDGAPAPSSAGLGHLERVRDAEVAAARDAVERSLSSLRTGLALLASGHTERGQQKEAFALESEFLALTMRVEDLLELASLRLDDGAVRLEPLMLDAAVRSAIEDAAAALAVQGLHVDLQTQSDVAVTADRARVREMALRFLDLGVRGLAGDARLHLRVLGDFGRARLEAEAPRLAEAVEGSVGLRVCRTIAALLGGRLEWTGRDRLSFSLPLRETRRRVPEGLADLRFL